MKRVAMFSPLPPCATGIADYTAELLPLLSEELDVDVYIDDYVPDPLQAGVRVRNWRLFESTLEREGYEVVVYQMGNSAYHEYMYPLAMRYPGVLVLHEMVLHHLVFGSTAAAGRWELYLRAMLEAHGRSGLEAARRAATGGPAPSFFEYPLSAGVIRRSAAIVVHSQFMRNAVQEIAPDIPTHVVPLHVAFESPENAVHASSGTSVRTDLGLREDEYLIGCFGLASPHKRLEVVLRAVRWLVPSVPNTRLVIVGEASPGYNFRAIIDQLGLSEHVTFTGRTSLADFRRYLEAMDVTVALRYPTGGETSASLVRMLAAGKATLTSRIGWFAELPDIVCPKIDVDEFEETTLFALLHLLYSRPDLRHRLGANARAYAQRNHSVSDTARAYQQVIAETPVFDGCLNDDELTRAFFRTFVGGLESPPGGIRGNHTGSRPAPPRSSLPPTFVRQLASALLAADLMPEPGSAFERGLAEAALSLACDVKLPVMPPESPRMTKLVL